jgi:hypothetical protein
MELTQTAIITKEHYQIMETYFSGLNFHVYLLDYDGDGYLDIILPNFVSN